MNKDTQKAAFDHSAGLYRPFNWLRDDVEYSPLNDFVATTVDITAGLETCLNLVNSSELERVQNVGSDPGEAVTPLLDVADSSNLLRLAIAANRLLHSHAMNQVERINEFKRKPPTQGGGA